MKNISPLAHALVKAKDEIAHLKIRETEMREALTHIRNDIESMAVGGMTMVWHERKARELLRSFDALLARESAEPAEEKGKPDPWENALFGIPVVVSPYLPVDLIVMTPDTLNRLRRAMQVNPTKEAHSEPAEERGPEVGDVVAIQFTDGRWNITVSDKGLSWSTAPRVVLMRRAEVEARMKGEGK
jgi:hypothetical protein